MFEMKPEAKPVLPADFRIWLSSIAQAARALAAIDTPDNGSNTIDDLYESYKYNAESLNPTAVTMSYSDFIDCVRKCGAFELCQVWHATLRV